MIRKKLRKMPWLYNFVRKIHIVIDEVINFPKHYIVSRKFKKRISNDITKKRKIWYFCIPVHSNLGDYAQYRCIQGWLSENYPNCKIIEIPTTPIRYDFCGLLKFLKDNIAKEELIVFQSGYTSSDLHSDEKVHRKIAKVFKNNKILFFPQTVKYSTEKEANKTAEIYNKHGNIVFLARDNVSFGTAKKLFINSKVIQMPDIVTTLIGVNTYFEKREGIAFCIRHDSEKKYSDKEIKTVFKTIMTDKDVWMDTTLEKNEICTLDILNAKIKEFSKHKVTVTDRFHGTIFSLIAATPVIILKTTDHKVTEGAEWFKEPFPDYIKIANNIEEACLFASEMLKTELSAITIPYFKNKYYDRLQELL